MAHAEEEKSAVLYKVRNEKYEHWKSKRSMTLNSNRPELLDEEASLKNITLSEFRVLVENLRKEKNQKLLQQIQVSLALGETYIKEFLSINGALYILTGILTGHDANLQLDAVCCIMNLTTGSHKPTFSVLKATAPYLITFLHGSSHSLQEQSAWTLGNMATDCEICRKQLRSQGFLTAMAPLLKSPNENVLMAVTFALRCYTRYEQDSTRELLDLGAARMIFELMKRETLDAGILVDVLFILFHFSASVGSFEVELYFLGDNLVEAVMGLLGKHCVGDVTVLTPVLRCLGNLSTSPAAAARIASNANFTSIMRMLMKNQYVHVRKELFWMLTNLICNGEVLEILDATEIIEDLPEMLKAKEEVVMEVLYFLCTLLTFQPKYGLKVSQTVIPQTVSALTNSIHENIAIMAGTTCSIIQNSLI